MANPDEKGRLGSRRRSHRRPAPAARAQWGRNVGVARQDDVVRVTGTVREFDIEEFEEYFGVDLDDAWDIYEGQPVIVAESVQ